MRIRFPSLVLGACLAAPALADDLPPATRAALDAAWRCPNPSVSIVVRDVATGSNLLAAQCRDAARARLDDEAPADLGRARPARAGLCLEDARLADAPVVKGVLKGNLYLQGGGDPLLTIERWWRFVNDLRQTGLRVIEGDIVIDQTRFTAADERPEDFDGKFWRTYNVLPDAMLVNWQSSDFTIRPADDGDGIDITIQPVPRRTRGREPREARERPLRRPQQPGRRTRSSRPGPTASSSTGRLSASCGPQSQRLAIMEPAQYAYGTFVTLWRQLGGQFRGGMLRAPTPPAARLLLTHESEPLSEIVRVTNKYSSNMMARSLVLAIAAEMNGTPATAAAGEADDRRLAQDARARVPGARHRQRLRPLARGAHLRGQHGEAPGRRAPEPLRAGIPDFARRSAGSTARSRSGSRTSTTRAASA